ncbi:uncharacterized protein LOC133321298 [Musca vetustissima]|uniref:uncharacterized protein LOC133321298 n=1 Tax=Musca vetustissima TaxID=27455 RepID=UPI002AB65E3B|nr:uncharacterized protein LOC133321298 [Musca vetustissima]
MVECPYNKAHRMLRKRLQSHLLKCRLQYPNVELRKCPFNLSHLIPEPEFTHHATNCPDRKLITQYKYDAPEDLDEEKPKHAPIESEENWDETDVADYDPSTYVEKATVIRCPQGPTPSERKEFIKQERKRLGDVDSEGDDDNDGVEVLEPRSESRNSERWERSRSKSPAQRTNRSDRIYNCNDEPYYNRPVNIENAPRNDSRNNHRRYERTPPPPPNISGSDNRAYNCDDDPYYRSNATSTSSRSYHEKDDRYRRQRPRSPKRRSSRDQLPPKKIYTHNSKSRYSKERSPSRNTRGYSPSNHKKSKYSDSRESHRHRSRSPTYSRRRNDNY